MGCMKGIIHGLLILFLLAVPVTAQAQFTYTTNGDAITIIPPGYTGSGGTVNIPPTINGLPVTSIDEEAFMPSLSRITSVTIPEGVTNIGELAFAGYDLQPNTSLASVTIPGSASLGDLVFWYCASLTNIVISNGVTSLGNDTFTDCTSLSSVVLPGSLTIIGAGVFADCTTLTNVTILGSVTSIGQSTFSDCPSLRSVYFNGNAPSADSTVFSSDNATTAYYLTGTSGWLAFSVNTGVPAVLWNTLIQTGDGSFGLRSNQFGFNITGTTNIPIVVEACTNLTSPVWTPLQSLTLTNGSFYFSEPFQTNTSGRFYRISSP
jgi:hypothetical protein